MRKKITLIVLVVTIILQLSVPVGMITYSKNAEADFIENGIEYKFKIDDLSIYSGKIYYSLTEEPRYYWEDKEYGVVAVDTEGFAYFEDFQDSRPSVHNYIRFTEANEEKLYRCETYSECSLGMIETKNISAYALIKVYDGNIEVVEIYIENLPAKEWVEKKSNENKEVKDKLIDFDT